MTTDEQIEREIRDKGLTAPRVTPASIEAKIKSEFYFTAEEGVIGRAAFQVESETLVSDLALPIAALASPSLERLTICVLILENGFTILGKSAPASAANFDAEMGRKIARADAFNQIWALEGYLLRQQLFTGQPPLEPPAEPEPLSYIDRMIGERADLEAKRDKLNPFIGSEGFSQLDAAEQQRLRQQAGVMEDYSAILNERIAFAQRGAS